MNNYVLKFVKSVRVNPESFIIEVHIKRRGIDSHFQIYTLIRERKGDNVYILNGTPGLSIEEVIQTFTELCRPGNSISQFEIKPYEPVKKKR